MASVNMTQQLQSEVVSNYRKQVQTAYEKSYDISSTMECIVSTLQDNAGPQFIHMQKLSKEFGKLAWETVEHYKAMIEKKSQPTANKWDRNDKHAYGYISTANGYHYSEEEMENIFEPMKPVNRMTFVVNSNRDTAMNLSMICEWHGPYTKRWSDGEKVEASKNYIEGDLVFNHEFAQPVYLPFTSYGGPNNNQAEEEYSPFCDTGVLVTCPKMCADIQTIPETEAKINQAIDKFEKFLLQFSTLKKFLDNYPEGRALVPQYAMEKMAAKAKPRGSSTTVQKLEVPDDLRDEMNQVILENKLLGDT